MYSPMTRTLSDLEFFWKAIVRMQPWQYDPSVCIQSARNRDHLFKELMSVPLLRTVRAHPLERHQALPFAQDRSFIR